jgi:hypothetical protein
MTTATTPVGTGIGVGVLNQTGQQPVGNLTIDGTAPDKNTVAAFVDGLATVPGLAAPYPASVASIVGGHQVTFTVNVIVTSSALGGRYAAATTSGNATSGGH